MKRITVTPEELKLVADSLNMNLIETQHLIETMKTSKKYKEQFRGDEIQFQKSMTRQLDKEFVLKKILKQVEGKLV